MKRGNLIIGTALLTAVINLASCVSDEHEGKTKESVTEVGWVELDLSVDNTVNVTVRDAATSSSSVDVNEFLVTITNEDGEVEISTAYSELAGESIELPTGTYTIEACSNTTLLDVMDEPYYYGSSELYIIADVTTKVSVVCTMMNTCIELVLEDDFLEFMSSWTITVSDGSNNLDYTSEDEDAESPALQYILVPDGTTQITVTISGYAAESGDLLRESRVITKSDGSAWGAGDALTISVSIGEEATYEATFTITVDVSFSENDDENVVIEVDPLGTGSSDDDEDEDDGDDDDSEDSDAVTITSDYLESGITWSNSDNSTIPESAIVTLTAENGFANIYVKITSGNDNFASAIEDLGLNAETDLLDTTTGVYAVLQMLMTLPEAGATSYELDLASFFSMMKQYGTTSDDGHQFTIRVVDTEGNSKTATIKIVITD